MVACPNHLAALLKSYVYDQGLKLDERRFTISRTRAWKIIRSAAEQAGITKRVHPHLLRHSDAIERLRQTGNPKALQIHLGHAKPVYDPALSLHPHRRGRLTDTAGGEVLGRGRI